MMKQVLTIVLFAAFLGLSSCNSKSNDKDLQSKVETLKQILDAFNRHDLDGIMAFFTDDCSFDFPRGSEPWGQRFLGKAQVREAIAGRFKGIPNVHYSDATQWVAGDRGVSEWLLSGTKTSGESVKVRICILWEFKYGKISRMDTYWKIVEQPTGI